MRYSVTIYTPHIITESGPLEGLLAVRQFLSHFRGFPRTIRREVQGVMIIPQIPYR